MILGFTGTQEGMSKLQSEKFAEIIDGIQLYLKEFHHGDCIGADAEAALVVHHTAALAKIVAHPCTIESKRAHSPFNDLILPVKPPLDRNVDIVKASRCMIATPKGKEEQRSGTWYTIRRSKKFKVPLLIIHPDGKTSIFE